MSFRIDSILNILELLKYYMQNKLVMWLTELIRYTNDLQGKKRAVWSVLTAQSIIVLHMTQKIGEAINLGHVFCIHMQLLAWQQEKSVMKSSNQIQQRHFSSPIVLSVAQIHFMYCENSNLINYRTFLSNLHWESCNPYYP